MARIFLSYRREESGAWAGRLYDRLIQHFGHDNVFMDVDTIEPGLDFVEVIERTVASCEVLIALIGRQWLTITDSSGQRRLDNPEDFVRLEIATALKRNIRVIPALIRGTSTARQKSFIGLGRQWTACVGPSKGLGQHGIKVSDKRQHPLLQILH